MTTNPLGLQDTELLRRQCYVDGQWIPADSGALLDVHNPATGELIAQVPLCGAAETQNAIQAAGRALAGWKQKTAAERSRLLRNWFQLLLQHQKDLARIMTLEQGKPLAESSAEIAYAASYIEWFAEEGKRAYG